MPSNNAITVTVKNRPYLQTYQEIYQRLKQLESETNKIIILSKEIDIEINRQEKEVAKIEEELAKSEAELAPFISNATFYLGCFTSFVSACVLVASSKQQINTSKIVSAGALLTGGYLVLNGIFNKPSIEKSTETKEYSASEVKPK